MKRKNQPASVPKANPDDPDVQPVPRGSHGPQPGPHFLGLEGRIALVQAQVFILAVIVIAQLWLITTALSELLSGQTSMSGWLALLSGLGFALAVMVMLPFRRRKAVEDS